MAGIQAIGTTLRRSIALDGYHGRVARGRLFLNHWYRIAGYPPMRFPHSRDNLV